MNIKKSKVLVVMTTLVLMIGMSVTLTGCVTSSHTAEPWGFPIGNLRSTTHLFFRLEGTSRSIEQIG